MMQAEDGFSQESLEGQTFPGPRALESLQRRLDERETLLTPS